MQHYRIGYNSRTSLYEVHVEGCSHPTRSLEYSYPAEAESGTAAAATFEARNEGCLTKLAPCAKAARA